MSELAHINGLELPDSLIELMERNRWKRPKNLDALRAISGMAKPEKLDFLKLRKMGAETEALFNVYKEGHGDLYGLVYDEPADDKLDVHRMIVLAVNDDEEGIALDYRSEPPSVMAGTWTGSGEDERSVWRTIAADFPTFAREIGLME